MFYRYPLPAALYKIFNSVRYAAHIGVLINKLEELGDDFEYIQYYKKGRSTSRTYSKRLKDTYK